MMSLVAICIFRPDDVLFLRKIAEFSLHIMVLLLAAGLFFLIMDQTRLVFLAFGSCAMLCLVFKTKADASIRQILRTSEPAINIVHTSTSTLAQDWEESFLAIDRLNTDVITFLEVTPAWQTVIDDYFKDEYTYRTSLVRIDDLGAAVYSMFPISSVDTIIHVNNPSLSLALSLPRDRTVHMILSNTNPPLFRQSFIELRDQLEVLGQEANKLEKQPLLVVGNYNLDQFSDELQDFRAQAKLRDSRKTMTPSLSPPTNHIFYNDYLEFLGFSNIYNRNSLRLGIQGRYQLVSK